ncbi:transposase [Pseudoalteromonas sp. T1lg75]|uniref:transposase n=1 Tax=Pseudoalteromonas sp. T1lg75 TaxID=2077102 RepID=UPI0018FE3092|nr:transposase [Pseudoalteromonas sp. T1lg75]
MTKKKRTQAYTEEFRREAVRRAELQGNTNKSVAEELGISAQQIYNWRRQFNRLSDKQFNTVQGVDYSKHESEELRRLKRELHDLKEENEFLKKAAAYFAKSQE